jgi:hypothetical protein
MPLPVRTGVKMDMKWVAAANLIHPSVAYATLVEMVNVPTISPLWAKRIPKIPLAE